MAEDIITFLGLGALLILVGYLQILNVRQALKTGNIAVGIRDTSRMREFNRDKNPVAYQLNFWPCLFAAIMCPPAGVAFIGFGIFLAIENKL